MRLASRRLGLRVWLAATPLALLASVVEAKTTLTFACRYTNAQNAIIERQIKAYDRANPEVDVVY